MKTDNEANPRKRKREEQHNAKDQKLREFLEVMSSGREGLATNETDPTVGIDHSLHPEHLHVSEEASDDEYEHIPSRKEKSTKAETKDHAEKSDRMVQMPPMKEQEAPGVQLPAGTIEGRPEKNDSETANHEPPTTQVADDDWLRSRTNRLLDLVDADEVTTKMVGTPVDKSMKQDMEVDRQSSHSSEEVTRDMAAEVATSQGIAKEQAVDTVSRTSRLFVRNLPYSATEDDLRETFDKFGVVQEVG